jgi:hypothetical protein
MDINEKLEENQFLVESINDDINILLNEFSIKGIAKDLIGLGVGGWKRFLTKKAITGTERELLDPIKKTIKDAEKEREEKEKSLEDDLSDDEKEKIQTDIDELNDRLDKLTTSLDNLSKELKGGDSKYKRVVIAFKEDYELDIEKLKSPEFKRNLKNRMYFKVLSHDQKNKTFDLQTNSFPIEIKLRLTYKKLEEFVKQNGKARLVFNKHTSSQHGLEGEEISVEFEFTSIEEK